VSAPRRQLAMMRAADLVQRLGQSRVALGELAAARSKRLVRLGERLVRAFEPLGVGAQLCFRRLHVVQHLAQAVVLRQSRGKLLGDPAQALLLVAKLRATHTRRRVSTRARARARRARSRTWATSDAIRACACVYRPSTMDTTCDTVALSAPHVDAGPLVTYPHVLVDERVPARAALGACWHRGVVEDNPRQLL
jgi:hypothetical protein